MDEQRYVVEITRPVPPEKVEQVSQRIAARLNVPQERIFTLLDGRVGEVTKPVLSDKADAIAEVFAEAGVRVIVAAARVDPPYYEEQFGQRESEAQPGGPRPAASGPASSAPDISRPATSAPGTPAPGTPGPGTPGADTPGADTPGPDTSQPATSEPAAAEPATNEYDHQAYAEASPAADYATEREAVAEAQDEQGDRYRQPARAERQDDPAPWDTPASWGVDTSEADTWRRPEPRFGGHDVETHGYGAGLDEPEKIDERAIETDAMGRDIDQDSDIDQDIDQDVDNDIDYGFDFGEAEEASDHASLVSDATYYYEELTEEPEPETGGWTEATDEPVAQAYEQAASETHAPEPETADVFVYSDEDPEEEVDRLGPSTRRLRVEYEEKPAPPPAQAGDYASSTRWTPSPHDPYAFTPEDSPGYSGRRSLPVGPASTKPLSPPTPVPRDATTREGIGGFYSPDYSKVPSEGPRLRTYLLWALIISLVVLILLQFVLAARVDGAVTVGAFEAGLVAFRRGEFAAARQVWEPLGDAGNAQAQYFLGFMLQNGLGQPWSNARAANWYRRAAQQGHTKAQLALGDLYFRGMGVEEDLRVGASWYASAAVAGDPDGQFEYAKLLLHGRGVEQDMHAALAWFEAAAANGVQAAADYVAYARTLAGAD